MKPTKSEFTSQLICSSWGWKCKQKHLCQAETPSKGKFHLSTVEQTSTLYLTRHDLICKSGSRETSALNTVAASEWRIKQTTPPSPFYDALLPNKVLWCLESIRSNIPLLKTSWLILGERSGRWGGHLTFPFLLKSDWAELQNSDQSRRTGAVHVRLKISNVIIFHALKGFYKSWSLLFINKPY